MATKRKDNKGLIILAIIALLLLLAGKKKAPGDGGGGTATPGGSVGSVDVTQGFYAARAHLVVKRIGDMVNISLSWTAATKDSAGNPINWNYGMSWRIISTTKAATVPIGFLDIGSRPNGAFSFSTSFFLDPNTLDPTFWLGSWTVQVTLHADNSSPTGQPLDDMPALQDDALFIGFGEHSNAFKVV